MILKIPQKLYYQQVRSSLLEKTISAICNMSTDLVPSPSSRSHGAVFASSFWNGSSLGLGKMIILPPIGGKYGVWLESMGTLANLTMDVEQSPLSAGLLS